MTQKRDSEKAQNGAQKKTQVNSFLGRVLIDRTEILLGIASFKKPPIGGISPSGDPIKPFLRQQSIKRRQKPGGAKNYMTHIGLPGLSLNFILGPKNLLSLAL